MHGPALLGIIRNGHWYPGIGDPTFMGWLIAIMYLVAAAACLIAARTCRGRAARAEHLFWVGFATVMFLLGINKQLDLQSWVTLTGRNMALSEGWYEHRRIVQTLFIFVVGIGGIAFLWLVWRLARKTVPQHRMALVGGVFLFCFVVIRASSFHHVDQFLGFSVGEHFRLNHMLELTGIFWVGVAAVRACREKIPHRAQARQVTI